MCQQLKSIPELKAGFNAIGFSQVNSCNNQFLLFSRYRPFPLHARFLWQGGQFFRAYVQRCNSPPVHNLITLGAQHAGVSEIPQCANQHSSFFCSIAKKIVAYGVYLSLVQHSVVQAQYFRVRFMLSNHPLTLISGCWKLRQLSRRQYLLARHQQWTWCFNSHFASPHLQVKNMTYKNNLRTLNRFVMFKFSEDQMVFPAGSSVRRLFL